jgi:hypothetical protein
MYLSSFPLRKEQEDEFKPVLPIQKGRENGIHAPFHPHPENLSRATILLWRLSGQVCPLSFKLNCGRGG